MIMYSSGKRSWSTFFKCPVVKITWTPTGTIEEVHREGGVNQTYWNRSSAERHADMLNTARGASQRYKSRTGFYK